MKELKVSVSGLEQCIAAQKALFEMGYGWSAGGKNVHEYGDAKEIYVDEDGRLSYSTWGGEIGLTFEKELVLAEDGKLVEVTAVAVETARMARPCAPSRGTDPSSSKAAGTSFDPTMLELEVLNAIRSFGTEGATQDDVLTKLRRISHSSITPRFRPLLNKGLVNDSGLKRKGVSGRGQRVMVAAY